MNSVHFSRAICRAFNRMWASWPLGAHHRCCICDRRVQRFLPYRDGAAGLPAVAREADIIGSDVENFECPACGCHDRERHLFMYLKAAGLMAAMRGARILHFAPEIHLERFIEAAKPSEYVRADLQPTRKVVRRLDLTDIALPDRGFDFVIANHVLEHVGDDAGALSEIHRVLRPGGHAILQTPFASRLEDTYEDAGITADGDRLRAFGQEDHVRLYGRNFAKHVESFGFLSKAASHVELLPDVDPGASGVNPREPFLLFVTPEGA